MSKTPDAVASARQQVFLGALQRWQQQSDQRRESLELIREKGPGAADSPEQLVKWAARETRRQLLGNFKLERQIGTWDLVDFAPSEEARKAARPVARLIDLPRPGTISEGFATGFLVSADLLLTNHHVFPRLVDAVGCAANFLYERRERNSINAGSYFELEPERFYFADEALDFCLVAVSPRGTQGESLADFGCVHLIEATGKTLRGRPINIIQHPKGGPRRWSISNNRLLDILDSGFLHYETDTDAGSSGSPSYNENWELVALHHCGIPATDEAGNVLKANGDIWNADSDDDSDVKWIANEGVRISSIVARLKTLQPPPPQAALLAQLLSSTIDPLASSAIVATIHESLPPSSPQAGTTGMHGITFNISGPTTINLSGNSPLPAAPTSPAPPATTSVSAALEKALSFDPDYPSRLGYDAGFLGIEVPPPSVDPSRLMEIYSVADYRKHQLSARNVPAISLEGMLDGQALALAYHHYSLAMNKKFRLLMWAASNADYRPETRADRRPRTAFGSEAWRFDRRVPSALQLSDKDIYGPARNFDRGHIVRREDSCWGEAGLSTEYANADTFHWTNCTPQHELFNQESPKGDEYRGSKGIWGQFEGALADQIEAGGGQAVIFAGPVLDTSCKVEDFGQGPVYYPMKFWKVVIVPRDESTNPELLAYGFVFDQSEAIAKYGLDVQETALALSKLFGKQQMALSDIEQLTGIRFPHIVLEADQFRAPGPAVAQPVESPIEAQ